MIQNLSSENPVAKPRGRFAPSPTGRMHLGNVFTALLSWLSVKSRGGEWILRIEDLDRGRSREEYARQIEDDLSWLGLEWDEGGINGTGTCGPYRQSLRDEKYRAALDRLKAMGLTYPCRCTRADLQASGAPHESDGRNVYAGRCRPESLKSPGIAYPTPPSPHLPVRSTRIAVDSRKISFTDRTYGLQAVDLSRHCGDFILQRADGAWAYQLAVVVDDADMGITEVVRGSDLLLSAAQQVYLYRLLGYDPPEFAHVPLISNHEGTRLSKRDAGTGMADLRSRYAPEEVTGYLAHLAGLMPDVKPISPKELLPGFSWEKINKPVQLEI